ncbi:MAG: helix-turn-helix domain-containing protein [Planctomycetota bacterium]
MGLDNDPDPKALALSRRLKSSRRRAGLSQKEAAAYLGVGESTVGTWERGLAELRALDLERWATMTSTDPAILLGWKSEQLGLPIVRSETTYLVRRDRVERIRAAKDISELRDLFRLGIAFGHAVTPQAEEVTADEWSRVERLVEFRIAELGGIPEDW